MVMISTRVLEFLAELMDIVEGARDGAVVEEHDAVGDAHRHNFGVRRASEWRARANRLAGQDAERAGAMAGIAERAPGHVGGVVRAVLVDEIFLQAPVEKLRRRLMIGIAGIQMGDAGSTVLRRAGLGDRLVELRMLRIANPIVRRAQRIVRVL